MIPRFSLLTPDRPVPESDSVERLETGEAAKKYDKCTIVGTSFDRASNKAMGKSNHENIFQPPSPSTFLRYIFSQLIIFL